MFKIMKEGAPNYLTNLVPKREPTIRTRSSSITIFNCRADCFKYLFSATLNDWFSLDLNTRNSKSISPFKKGYCLSFTQFKEAYNINIFHSKPLKFQIRLRLGFNHFNEHIFRTQFSRLFESLMFL